MPRTSSTPVLGIFAFILNAGFTFAQAPWTTAPFSPPALPLAVRNPYLNIWLPQGNKSAGLSDTWPNIWDLETNMGWFAAVKVDGIVYRVMGRDGGTDIGVANQSSIEFTATKTSFLLTCGPVEVNATFLSPIEPTDLVRLTLPFSYLYMSAQSTDGNAHNVSMYSDVTAALSSGDAFKIASWTTHVDNNYVILQTQAQSVEPFSEVKDHAEDAIVYYGMKAGPGVSWQISRDTPAWNNFSEVTSLANAADPPSEFRPIINNTVFAIAVDFGKIINTPEPAVWALGVVRDPSIQYVNWKGEVEKRHSYYMTSFDSALSAAQMFIDDFTTAVNSSSALDAHVLADGLRYSPEYADLLSLSLRQAMSAMDVTLSQGSDGAWNGTDIKAFMKNMGGVGTSSGVNAVDVLYAALPVYMYLNPELVGYLLEPLLEYQDTPMYDLQYAAQNIGSTFPNATADGLDQPHEHGVEESANMLIMTLAHAQASGNGTLIGSHYSLLRGWADYLVNNSLTPIDQLSPDATILSKNNQTNIALKGIIGIAAMATMSGFAGKNDDVSNYKAIAESYSLQWTSLAKSSDNLHLVMEYGAQQTSGLMYNLYADRLLQLNIVPDEIYDIQTKFYKSAVASTSFGLPLDSGDPQLTRADWIMLSAATVTEDGVQESMVSMLHKYSETDQSGNPLCVSYDPTRGSCLEGQNSPALGGIFSLLALNETIKQVSVPPGGNKGPGNSEPSSSHKSISTGVIGGLAATGIIVFAAVIIAFILLHRRQERPKQSLQIASAYSLNDRSSDAGNTCTTPQLSGPMEFIATQKATNFRDSSYFIDGQETSLGPSASQVWCRVVSEGNPDVPLIPGQDSQKLDAAAKTSEDSEGLRLQMYRLRRDLERVRLELEAGRETPPIYSQLI